MNLLEPTHQSQASAETAEYRARLQEPQRHPLPDEQRIDAFFRVQWLMTHHMQKLNDFAVAARFPELYLGERDGEMLLGFYEEPNGEWWRVTSHPVKGGLEMLRLDAESIADWQANMP